MSSYQKTTSAFTLIELSVVMVIIGLLVGGILTGRDLMDSAAQRAQITQIERYNTAVRTFQGKYGYLPGDIPDPYASNFGFQGRGTFTGEGDGNGVLAGNCGNSAGSYNYFEMGCGEPAVFWQDLSTASLIDSYIGTGANYPSTTGASSGILLSGSVPTLPAWLPSAKLGNSDFVYVYGMFGKNYFAISSVTKIGQSIESTANPGITVQQAYNIDSKIDDGLPQSGSVTTCYVNYKVGILSAVYAGGLEPLQGANSGDNDTGNGGDNCTPTTAATPYATTNCYDNSYAGGSAPTQKYQLQNANIQNCALSFKFQ